LDNLNAAEITISAEGSTVTIKGAGSLDLTNAQRFREGLVSASASAEEVVVDLRSAVFIDTAILEYIARGAKTMLDRGKQLKVLVRDNSHPQYVLKTVGFEELMDIRADAGDCMRSAKQGNDVGAMVAAAAAAGTVIPAFNVPYLPMVEAVARALAEHGTFGMIQVARLELVKFQARSLAAVAEEYTKHADPRVASLHLDHTPVIDEDNLVVDWEPLIAEAISLGYDSVMIDGSRLPLDENIAVTKRVVDMAHPCGIFVEAELGSVLGHEAGPLPPYDELFASKAGFTIPEEARRFVEETGVDWLSVSVGSVHGAISPAAKDQQKVQAKLDIEHLRKLRDVTGIHLVLHGGSGIEQSYIDAGIASGIAKINIGTDIRQPYERALAAGGSVREAQAAVAEAIGRLICDAYHIEGSAARLRRLAMERSGK